MNNRVRSHSGVMMFELVIVIAFFIVLSAILLNIFSATKDMTDKAEKTSKAILLAESSLEKIISTDDKESVVLGEQIIDKDDLSINVKASDEETENGIISTYIVSVFDESEEIYTVKTKKYWRGGLLDE